MMMKMSFSNPSAGHTLEQYEGETLISWRVFTSRVLVWLTGCTCQENLLSILAINCGLAEAPHRTASWLLNSEAHTSSIANITARLCYSLSLQLWSLRMINFTYICEFYKTADTGVFTVTSQLLTTALFHDLCNRKRSWYTQKHHIIVQRMSAESSEPTSLGGGGVVSIKKFSNFITFG